MLLDIEVFVAPLIIISCLGLLTYCYTFLKGFKKNKTADIIELQSYKDMKLGREFRTLKDMSNFQRIQKLDELLRQVD